MLSILFLYKKKKKKERQKIQEADFFKSGFKIGSYV